MCINNPEKTSCTEREDTNTTNDILRKKKLKLIKKKIAQGLYNVKSEELAEKMVQYLNDNDMCEMPSSKQKKIIE